MGIPLSGAAFPFGEGGAQRRMRFPHVALRACVPIDVVPATRTSSVFRLNCKQFNRNPPSPEGKAYWGRWRTAPDEIPIAFPGDFAKSLICQNQFRQRRNRKSPQDFRLSGEGGPRSGSDEVPSRCALRLCSNRRCPSAEDLISLTFGQPASPEGKPFGCDSNPIP